MTFRLDVVWVPIGGTMKLDFSFYRQDDVVSIARSLIGTRLFTRINGRVTSGRIVETEAYAPSEKGSHAYAYRRTPRNEAMYGPGGNAYVYLCYGIHHLFNVVTNEKHVPDAVLIRALEPEEGIPLMMKRMGTDNMRRITSGPGKLSKAMGINLSFNAASLRSTQIWIEEGDLPKLITVGPRIGIDYAGKDARLPWRFSEKGNIWVSR